MNNIFTDIIVPRPQATELSSTWVRSVMTKGMSKLNYCRRAVSFFIVVLGLSCFFMTPGVLAEENPLSSYAKSLNSQSFIERKNAQRELVQFASEHLDEVEILAFNSEPETAERLVEILESVFLKNGDKLGEQAEQILERLSSAGGAASVSAGLVLQSNARLRETRARIALEKLGAQFIYYTPGASMNGQALFGFQAATLPEVGVGFGPPAVLHSIYLHEDWSGTKDDLWHLKRLSNHQDLVIFSIKGNSVEINELYLLTSYLRGLSIYERGACLGITSQPYSTGCRVGTVVEGAAANKGGLLTGDLVILLDELPIRNFQHLVLTLQDFKIGDEVTFTIIRDGAQLEKIVTLGSWRDTIHNSPMTVETPPPFGGPFDTEKQPEEIDNPEGQQKNDSTTEAVESPDKDQ